MRVLVTRPRQQGTEWVARLRDAGIDAVALPLIGIGPSAEPAAVHATWATLAERRLVVFVSANAAEQFFALQPAGSAWPIAVLAASPGPGTTQALLRLGVPQAQIVEPAADAAQFDSESLWAAMRDADWRGARVLIVRGEGGREWLAQTLRAHDAQVELLAAYRREMPALDDADRVLLRSALTAPREHLWLFSSSEAIDNLALALPGAEWVNARAVTTHPRIAGRARRLGFSSVIEARPTLDAMVACIQSMQP